MSLKNLKDAVLSIAEEMIQEANDLKDKRNDVGQAFLHDSLKSHARTLRAVVRAAGDDPVPGAQAPLLTPMSQHVQEIEKARAEFKKPKKDLIAIEERYEGGDMVQVVGGPASEDGATYQNVDPQMPIGARTHLAGGIYQLRKEGDKPRQLVFDEQETQRVKQQLEKQQ